MTVGQRIRARRTALHISQTQLAEKAHISKQTLYKYETDVIRNIPGDKLRELALLLNTTPAFLMGWDEENEAEKLKFALFNASEGITDEMLSEVLEFAQFVKSKHAKENS